MEIGGALSSRRGLLFLPFSPPKDLQKGGKGIACYISVPPHVPTSGISPLVGKIAFFFYSSQLFVVATSDKTSLGVIVAEIKICSYLDH